MRQPDAMAVDGPEVQYLTFRLANEEYAIDILAVHEIKSYSAITPIPNTPEYVKGVINLRGTILPIVDLRERFSLPRGPYDKFTVFLIVRLGKRLVGLVVDAVNDVLTVREGELDAPPAIAFAHDASFVRGLAKAGDRVVVVLDYDEVLRTSLASVAAAPSERAAC